MSHEVNLSHTNTDRDTHTHRHTPAFHIWAEVDVTGIRLPMLQKGRGTWESDNAHAHNQHGIKNIQGLSEGEGSLLQCHDSMSKEFDSTMADSLSSGSSIRVGTGTKLIGCMGTRPLGTSLRSCGIKLHSIHLHFD